MKRFVILGICAVAVACAENPTQPETQSLKMPGLTVLSPAGVNLLVCLSGSDQPSAVPNYGGTCSLSADHKKAVLTNNSSDSDGDFASVYSFDLTVYGELLSNITELSYSYKSLNVPALVPQLGNLSFNISIDTDGDLDNDFYAFVDAANCGKKASATVNIVTMASCGIQAGAPVNTLYPNWAAFVAAFPGARVENLHDYIFIIAERTPSEPSASWQISNVKFGKTGLICVDGPSAGTSLGGSCTLGEKFKSATLDNSIADPDGDIAGVFSKETTGYGLFLSNIKDLTYKYSGPVPTLKSLGYYIPIDAGGDGNTDFIVVADATNCRGTSNASGVWTVNITRDLVCGIDVGVATASPPYANWAAFAAAFPSARTSYDPATMEYMAIVATRNSGDPAAIWSILEAKWGTKK